MCISYSPRHCGAVDEASISGAGGYEPVKADFDRLFFPSKAIFLFLASMRVYAPFRFMVV